MSNLEKALNDYVRGCAPYVHVADFEAGYRAAMRQEPTHYAVIDEYGEIIFSARIAAILDPERKCQDFIRRCKNDPVTRNETPNWTIKGGK